MKESRLFFMSKLQNARTKFPFKIPGKIQKSEQASCFLNVEHKWDQFENVKNRAKRKERDQRTTYILEDNS